MGERATSVCARRAAPSLSASDDCGDKPEQVPHETKAWAARCAARRAAASAPRCRAPPARKCESYVLEEPWSGTRKRRPAARRSGRPMLWSRVEPVLACRRSHRCLKDLARPCGRRRKLPSRPFPSAPHVYVIVAKILAALRPMPFPDLPLSREPVEHRLCISSIGS